MSKSPCRLPDRSLAIADRSNRPDAAESPCPRLADPYIQAHEYCLAENEDRLAMPRKSLSAPLALVALVMTPAAVQAAVERSGEPTSELQALVRTSYAVFFLKTKTYA